MKALNNVFSIAVRALGAAALAVVLGIPASASINEMVAEEARSLQGKASKLVELSKKGDFATLRAKVASFQSSADALVERIEGYESQAADWSGEQREAYDLLLTKAKLMSHFADRKATLIDKDPDAYKRSIRDKAKNLLKRAKLLEQAAESTSLPAAATD